MALRDARTVLLVDAANVIGSRPNGWWRDRPGAAQKLTARIRHAVTDGVLPAGVVLVLEGEAKKGVAEGLFDGVRVVHAPGNGDDTLMDVAERSTTPVVLVSADRELRSRVQRIGAEVVGPTWLLDRLSS